MWIMIKKLLVGVLVLTTTACTTLQHELKNYLNKPVVNYKSISVGKLAIDAIELNPTFNVQNKNAFPIPINEATYELYLNNDKVLDGTTNAIGTLPANQDKDVTLSLNLTQETLISLQHILLRDKQLNYRVKGNVNAMGLTLPFEKSDTLYVPDLKVVDMQVVNASFTKLDIMLKLEVTNTNNFNLPLENIHYSVSSNRNILFNGDLKDQNVAKGSNTIQLPLTIKPNTLFTNIFALLNNPVLPLHFEINTPLFNKSYDHSLNLSSFFFAKEKLNTFNL
ncbi:hypothetical protein E2R67_07025 [Psychromonas sp. RZ5]|nr:hypothetical protein E2R67_07025 [Psychromonas sp. RZ5]